MRDAILASMEQKGLSRYAVAKAVTGKVSAQAVYDYLAGRRDMTGGFLWHVLNAVGLEIRPKR